MYLSNVKVQGRPFQHYLFATGLPVRLEDTELASLISLIKQGSVEARDAVVSSHVSLIMSIVSRYVAKLGSTRLADDLVAAALTAALEVVERVRIGTYIMYDDNITAVIVKAVHSALSKLIEHEPLVKVPGSTRRTRELAGQPPIEVPSCHALNDEFQTGNESVSDGDEFVQTQGWWKVQQRKRFAPWTEVEILAALNRVIETPLERTIVDMRVNNTDKPATDSEIADATGYSISYVNTVRHKLGMKLKKELQ